MDRHEAEQTIHDVERIRRDTRHALNPVWLGNLAFGVFFAGVATLGFAGAGADLTSMYWLAGGALAFALVIRHYARLERALGAQSPVLDASTAVLLAMLAGIVAANLLTSGLENAIAPVYVSALGIVSLGLVLRDRVEIAAGIGLAVVATALAAAAPEEPGPWSNLGVAAVLVVAGLVGRSRA